MKKNDQKDDITLTEADIKTAKEAVQKEFHDNSPALKEALGKTEFQKVENMVKGMDRVLTDPGYSKGMTAEQSLEMKAETISLTMDKINKGLGHKAELVKDAKEVAKPEFQKEKSTVSKVQSMIGAAAKVVKTSAKVAVTSKTDENYHLYKQQSKIAKMKLSAAQFSTTKSAEQLDKLAAKVEETKGTVSTSISAQKAKLDSKRGASR